MKFQIMQGWGQESQHNLTYWRYKDYVGIGPGAHGRLTLTNGDKVATRTHKAPDVWMNNVFENGHGAKPFEVLNTQDQLEEGLMMGLRLREGVEMSALPINKLSTLFDNDFLRCENDRIFCTAR